MLLLLTQHGQRGHLFSAAQGGVQEHIHHTLHVRLMQTMTAFFLIPQPSAAAQASFIPGPPDAVTSLSPPI